MARVEITAENVHTTQGKLLRGSRADLPDDEARWLVSRGLAKRKRQRKREPQAEPMTLDVPQEAGDEDGEAITEVNADGT